MSKSKKKDLSLLVKPEEGKAFGDLEYVWAEANEVSEYLLNGYVTVKFYKTYEKDQGWK
jgi:hypothetical protein